METYLRSVTNELLNRPTTLDLVLAAHVLLLVQTALPDTLLSSLVSSSFPTLLSHARRVLETVAPSPRVLPPEGYNLSALIPYPSFRTWWSEPRIPKTEEEKRFDRMRWQWIGLAVVGSIGYWVLWGPKLRVVRLEDDNDDDEHLAIIVGGGTGDLGVDEYEDDMGGPEDEVEVEVESDGNAEAG
jgi:sorting and assembly machinery component 37